MRPSTRGSFLSLTVQPEPGKGSIINDQGDITGERITWTASKQEKAVTIVELIFNKATEDYPAAVADLKIFYRLPGRYRSLKVDEWVDGSCLRTENILSTGVEVLESSNEVTIWKGKLMCQKLGFAFALFSKRRVFCQNSIRREINSEKCIFQCPGEQDKKCGSVNFSNVYLTTGGFQLYSRSASLLILT